MEGQRSDIAAAYGALDPKGQGTITGMGASRKIKKAFQSLAEFLPDETVLALAAGMDPPLHMAEQRQLGRTGSLEEIARRGKSGRLLVVTKGNLWEIQASGRLNGNRPEGVRIPLIHVTDVRTRANRRMASFGTKERFLSVDYLHGASVETRVHFLHSDGALETFATALLSQVQTIHQEAAAAEEPRATVAPETSTVDELTKLADLRDRGVLSDEEFEGEKARLLGDAGVGGPTH